MSEIQKSGDQDEKNSGCLQARIRTMPWLIWLLGAAACAALILVVTHLTEEEEFLRLTQRIELSWLAMALLIQSATYITQGMVWRLLTQSMGYPLAMGKALELGLAMLFVNQALPSAGASGMAMLSGALSRAGMPRAVVVSAVLVNEAMYCLSYALCMAVALGIARRHCYLPDWVSAAMLLFVFAGLGVSWFMTALPSGGMSGLKARLRFNTKLARLLDSVDQARPDSFRQKRVMIQALFIHTITFLLDATTIWVATRALGVTASPGGIFTSFMVSTLFRTIGIMPGGLGTFETASVMSLKSIGLPLSVGLSATLLFRGLSFWLPMIPGLICSRHLLAKQHNNVG